MTIAQIADRNGRVEDLAGFVAVDKAFQRAAKRMGLTAVPFTPSNSVTARWAVPAATQGDIAQIVRLTKIPMAWEEKPGGGWHVFPVFGADLARCESAKDVAPHVTHEGAIEKAIGMFCGHPEWYEISQSKRDRIWGGLRWLVDVTHGVDAPEPFGHMNDAPGKPSATEIANLKARLAEASEEIDINHGRMVEAEQVRDLWRAYAQTIRLSGTAAMNARRKAVAALRARGIDPEESTS